MGDNHVVTTILIVEDEPAHAELIETNLRRGSLGQFDTLLAVPKNG